MPFISARKSSLSKFCLFISLVLKKSNNNILYGKVIVIDPGHGGADCGAYRENIYEKDINLAIGEVNYHIGASKLLFYKTLSDICGINILNDFDLIN